MTKGCASEKVVSFLPQSPGFLRQTVSNVSFLLTRLEIIHIIHCSSPFSIKQCILHSFNISTSMASLFLVFYSFFLNQLYWGIIIQCSANHCISTCSLMSFIKDARSHNHHYRLLYHSFSFFFFFLTFICITPFYSAYLGFSLSLPF